jgi:hypothetical protein
MKINYDGAAIKARLLARAEKIRNHRYTPKHPKGTHFGEAWFGVRFKVEPIHENKLFYKIPRQTSK